jgi:hypothetical protein
VGTSGGRLGLEGNSLKGNIGMQSLLSLSLSLSLSVFSSHHEVNSFVPPHVPCHEVLPQLRPKAIQPNHHGVKPLKLKLCAEINLTLL